MVPIVLRRLGALAASFALAAVTVEFGLRLAYPAETRHYVHPPRVTRIIRPDPTWVQGVSAELRFTINSQGIRGREPSADEYRILAVGGSTTECAYQDDTKAWPAAVGAALPRTGGGLRVWVGNAGKSGANARDNVVQLQHLSAELPRIDMAILLAGVNDLTVTLARGDAYAMPAPITDPEAQRQQTRKAFAIAPGRIEEPSTDELGPPGTRFYKRTALYQLLKRAKDATASLLHPNGLVEDVRGEMYERWREHRRHAPRILTEAPDLTAPLAEYRRNLNVITDLATARGMTLVMMTQPTLWRADLPEEARALLWLGGVGEFQQQAGSAYYSVEVLEETMRRFNAVMLDVCRERRLPCLDLAARVPRDTTMFYDDTHFTDAGSRAVTVAVVEHLQSLPPFARGRGTTDRPSSMVISP